MFVEIALLGALMISFFCALWSLLCSFRAYKTLEKYLAVLIRKYQYDARSYAFLQEHSASDDAVHRFLVDAAEELDDENERQEILTTLLQHLGVAE